jgi:phosphoglycolate phosphatase
LAAFALLITAAMAAPQRRGRGFCPPPPFHFARFRLGCAATSDPEPTVTQPPILVLDLDGTLVDTAPDLMAALNVCLTQEGLRNMSLDESIAMIGAGARALLERGLAATGAERSKAEVDALFAVFLDHYTAHIADMSRPYPGVVDAIDHFASRGWKIAVCTNKLESLSRALLRALSIEGRFAAVGGGDTFPVKKPDPRHLRETIALAGGDPARAVMVGDSETDIATAKNANIPVVAVDFGYTTVHVREYRPERIISHFRDLPDAVASLPGFAGL